MLFLSIKEYKHMQLVAQVSTSNEALLCTSDSIMPMDSLRPQYHHSRYLQPASCSSSYQIPQTANIPVVWVCLFLRKGRSKLKTEPSHSQAITEVYASKKCAPDPHLREEQRVPCQGSQSKPADRYSGQFHLGKGRKSQQILVFPAHTMTPQAGLPELQLIQSLPSGLEVHVVLEPAPNIKTDVAIFQLRRCSQGFQVCKAR